MNLDKLKAQYNERVTAASTLWKEQGIKCDAHVVTPAADGVPAVTGRVRTAEETAAVERILEDARVLKGQLDAATGDVNKQAEIERLTASLAPPSHGRSADGRDTRGMGARFMNDPHVQAFLKAGGHQRQGQWTSPGLEMQAALIDTSSGSAGPLIVPDYLPGIQLLPSRAPVVADLIAPGSTDSNAIIYMKEKTATNAAAAVAEGVAKPESTLVYEQATDPVVKIATWIPATTEALEDIPAMASMIDARLRMFLALAEDDQLLNGSGVAPNMRGIMNRLALAAAVARGADSNADAMMKQISAIFTNALIQPDGFVMNPANWLTIQLTKNAAGNYLGTGPWAAPQAPMLWGLPGAITPAIVANTALVGAFKTCAQFFRKGGVKLAMSNSHASYFVENKVAILIEERGALAVYREAAFGKVTGLS